jgi:lipid A 3-O-deacylase
MRGHICLSAQRKARTHACNRCTRLRRGILFVGAAVLGIVSSCPAHADPPPDPHRIVTLQVENDATAGTDRYYTSGLRLGYTTPTGGLPDGLARLGQALFGAGQQRLALGLSQLLFTPRNTQIAPPDPRDRPYAGLLLGNVALIHDTDRARSVIDLDLGVIGPAALGKQLQNGFHHLIGQGPNRGWGSQFPNQPVAEVLVSRVWRLPIASAGPLEFDALPTLTAGLGTWRVYGLAGGQVRMGQGLASDFGTPLIAPGLNGWDAYNATRPFAWYVFAGIDGQAVGFDETIDGEPFRSTPHVSRIPAIGEFQAGIAVMAFGLRISFTDVVRSREFHGQAGGPFQYGSASVSFKF